MDQNLKLLPKIKIRYPFFVTGYELQDASGKVLFSIKNSVWGTSYTVFDDSGKIILAIKSSWFNRQRFIDPAGKEIAALKSFLMPGKSPLLLKDGVKIGSMEKEGIYLRGEKIISIEREKFLNRLTTNPEGYSFTVHSRIEKPEFLVVLGALVVFISWIEGRMR